MRIMVTGGREFNNYAIAKSALEKYLSQTDTLVHGGCRGCDLLCAKVASEIGAKVEEHKADWNKYGRAAGPIRNREMLESGIDLVIAFPGGKGTNNAIKTAQAFGTPIVKIDQNE